MRKEHDDIEEEDIELITDVLTGLKYMFYFYVLFFVGLFGIKTFS